MIHGFPNSPPSVAYMSERLDDGCIALSKLRMVEVWLRTQDNIPIDISLESLSSILPNRSAWKLDSFVRHGRCAGGPKGH